MFIRLSTVLLGEQLTKDTEAYGRFQRCAGFGNDIDVKILITEAVEKITEIVGRKPVADEEYLWVIFCREGTQQFNGAARSEIGTSDSDHNQCFGAGTDLLSCSNNPVQLMFLHITGESHPARKISTCSGAFSQCFVCFGSERIVNSAFLQELFRTAEIYFNHNTASLKS